MCFERYCIINYFLPGFVIISLPLQLKNDWMILPSKIWFYSVVTILLQFPVIYGFTKNGKRHTKIAMQH